MQAFGRVTHGQVIGQQRGHIDVLTQIQAFALTGLQVYQAIFLNEPLDCGVRYGVPTNDVQFLEDIGRHMASLDRLEPHGVWEVQDVKDMHEFETADLGQVDQWTSIGYGGGHCCNAHARSSIMA